MSARSGGRCFAAACGIALAVSSCSGGKEEPPAELEGRQGTVVTQPELVALRPEPYSIGHWPQPESTTNDPWENKYLEANGDIDRIEIISEKQTGGPESLAPLLRRALRSKTLELNAQAIDSASVLRGEDAIDILSGATSHSSVEIAILAAEAARELPSETRMEIYENNLASPHEPVRELTVIELSRQESKPAIELLILGLLDPAEAVVETTNKGLERLFNRTFDSASAAKQWWAENQHEYSDTLKHIVSP
ncbi:MAG: hypothetical protein ACI9UA_004344 [Pseudoalteromonas tetraodonis]|jgi:hypothetical protein